MKQLPLLFLLVTFILLSACTPKNRIHSEKNQSTTVISDPLAEQANALYEAQDFENAIPLLEELSLRTPPERWEWQLKTADAYLQNGQTQRTQELIEPLSDKQFSSNSRELLRLIQASLAMQNFNPEEALSILYQPPSISIRETLQHRYYQLLAKAYRFNGNLLESANALIQLDHQLLAEPELRLDNQLAIIRTLATLTDSALTLLQPNPPGVQGGWMSLSHLIKRYGQAPDELEPELARWKEQFPRHPAMPELLGGYFQKLESQYQQASHIAVLLPETGRYKKAAESIKKGLLAAWYHQAENIRPQLRFYDSSNPENIWPLYSEATQKGADFIIGPLQKSAVNQMIHAGELAVPVLALNHVNVDTNPPENFYQFALSPEDEARQVAERAWLDGKRQPILLIPRGSWGNRIKNAFEQRWQSLGGEITETQTYNAKKSDFGVPIQALLDIDQSKQRRRKIQQLIGERVEFEPRRREDIDFIFVAAHPQQARQIRPQLQFHHAISLPIYTTSSAWQGFIDKDKDRDIEGILFPDIPWLLADEGEQPLSLKKLRSLLDLKKSKSLRLVAMGIDGYQLLGHLARLQASEAESLDGKTGQLYMDRLNTVHRQLVWATMKHSIPNVIGYAPRLYPQKQSRDLNEFNEQKSFSVNDSQAKP